MTDINDMFDLAEQDGFYEQEGLSRTPKAVPAPEPPDEDIYEEENASDDDDQEIEADDEEVEDSGAQVSNQAQADSTPSLPIAIESEPAKEPYNFKLSTVKIGITLAPEQDGDRLLVFGITTHNDLPILRSYQLSQMPVARWGEVIQEMAKELMQKLPDRQIKSMEREVKKKAPATTTSKTSSATAKPGAKPVQPAKKAEKQLDMFGGAK